MIEQDQSRIVELAVLGVLLDGRHGALWPHACDLTCDHFASRDHRLVWMAMLRLGQRGERIDAGSVASEMAGIPIQDALDALKAKTAKEALDMAAQAGLEFGSSCLAAIGGFNGLGSIAEAFSPVSGFQINIDLLRRYRDQRELQRIFGHYLREATWPTTRDRVGEVAGDAIAALQSLVQARSTSNLGQALTSALGSAQRAANARTAGSQVATSWGLGVLDRMCPLRPGGVYVVAAGSGGGKTSLALQAAQATAAAHGRAHVAIAALEMPATDLATIMAGRTLGISPTAILEGSPELTDIDWRDLRELAEKWTSENTSHIRDLDAGHSQTVEAILGWFQQRHQASGGLALGIIDYLQLLEPTNAKWTEYQTLCHATRAIKLAASRLQIPIILLAQFNRKGTTALRDKGGALAANPEPSMSDLKGSGSIENDADAVLLLHRPDPNARGTHIPTRIIIAKQRRGSTGVIDVAFRGAHQLFEEAAPPAEQHRHEKMERPVSASEDLFA